MSKLNQTFLTMNQINFLNWIDNRFSISMLIYWKLKLKNIVFKEN